MQVSVPGATGYVSVPPSKEKSDPKRGSSRWTSEGLLLKPLRWAPCRDMGSIQHQPQELGRVAYSGPGNLIQEAAMTGKERRLMSRGRWGHSLSKLLHVRGQRAEGKLWGRRSCFRLHMGRAFWSPHHCNTSPSCTRQAATAIAVAGKDVLQDEL
jgi:hypothetical protein